MGDPKVGAGNAPRWVLIVGSGAGFLTLVFLMGLVVLSIWGKPVPEGGKFPLVAALALGTALSSGFLGGYAAAEGRLPLARTLSPVTFGVGGGIAVFVIVLGLGYWLYIDPSHNRQLSRSEAIAEEQLHKINRIHAIYLASTDEGAQATNDVLFRAPAAAEKLLRLSDSDLDLAHQIVKYEYAGFAYAMAAKLSSGKGQEDYANKGLELTDGALKRMKEVEDLAARGEPAGIYWERWLEQAQDRERTLYYSALCWAVVESKNPGSQYAKTIETLRRLNRLNPQYVQRHDPSQNDYLKGPWEKVKAE
jgi:hypothetical protein